MALVALLCACSSDKPTNTGNPEISITIAPTALTVARNSTGNVTINLARGGSYTGAVSLAAEGVPTGVTATFAPAALTTGSSSVLSLAVGGNAPVGQATITVRASGQGVTARTATFTLTIPAPEMGLQLGATTATLTRGASTTVPVTITRTNGFDQPVTMSVQGLPTGVSASFDPSPIAGNGTTSTLTLTATNDAITGPATVTVTATGNGVTAQSKTLDITVNAATQPDFSLSVAPAAHNIVAGSNAQSTVTISRTGGFAGAVTLVLEGAPDGVSATFTPNATATGTSTLAISTTAATPAGTHNLTIRGTGAGVTGSRITQLSLTVAAPPGLTLALSNGAFSVQQGQSGQTVVTLTRTGGLAGNVNLTVEGAPQGVTASFDPNPAAGATSTLTLNVAGAVPANIYNLTVRGTGAGNVTSTTPLQLTVTTGGGSGGGNVAWQFCDAARIPVWFAYRDGTNGAWTRVTPGANNTFSFTLTQPVGGVAYVENGGSSTEVFYLTASEMSAVALAECATSTDNGKTIHGTVSGLADDEFATVAMGGVSESFIQSDFDLTGVPQGPQGLIAVRGKLNEETGEVVPNRMLLLRAQNIANNGSLPPLNFGDAASFAPATATINFSNTGGNAVNSSLSWVAADKTSNEYYFTTGNSFTFYGVPTNRQMAGELHEIWASAYNEAFTEGRVVVSYIGAVANKTIAFGPALGTPNITSTTSSGIARPRAQGTFQAEYDLSIGVAFMQTAQDRFVSITASRAYFGNSPTYDLQTPDLAAVPGFNLAWGLQPGVTTQASFTAMGVEGGGSSAAVAATSRMLDARRHAGSASSGVAAMQAAMSSSSIPVFNIVEGLVLFLAILLMTFTA